MIKVKIERPAERILDFDIETLAGGYADPSWVPDKITAAAWSWVGDDKVSSIVDPMGYFDKRKRRKILQPLLAAIELADIVQGHNIIRFDLRVIQAEAMRLGIPRISKELRVIDTMRIGKAKGYKKSQDDIAVSLGVPVAKKKLGWTEWDDAYEEGAPWKTVTERVEGDVIQHKLMTVAMQEKGWLGAPGTWRP